MTLPCVCTYNSMRVPGTGFYWLRMLGEFQYMSRSVSPCSTVDPRLATHICTALKYPDTQEIRLSEGVECSTCGAIVHCRSQ